MKTFSRTAEFCLRYFALLPLFLAAMGGFSHGAAAQEIWQGAVANKPPILGSSSCAVAQAEEIATYGTPTPAFQNCTYNDGAHTSVSANYYDICNFGRGDTPCHLRFGIATLVGCEAGFTRTLNGCERTPPPDPKCTCEGDPIQAPAGTTSEQVIDFKTAGPNPLIFQRYYSNNGNPIASEDRNSDLGAGWRSNFGARMVGDGSTQFMAVLPNGKELRYVWNGSAMAPAGLNPSSGAYVSGLTGISEQIAIDGANNLRLITQDGTAYIFRNDYQNHKYPLIEIDFPGGYKQTPTYSNGVMTGVSDNLGRSLAFSYDAFGRITGVAYKGTTVVEYTYIPRDHVEILAPYYPGGVPSSLAMGVATIQTVTYPTQNNAAITYRYEDANNPLALTGVTDERGIAYSAWAYDSSGRTTSSQLAGPTDTTSLAYDDANHKVTISNPLGWEKIVNYSFASPGYRLIQSISGVATTGIPASTRSFLYDSNNYVSQVTDEEGRVTAYVNDPTTGLHTSITRGYGSGAAATTTTETWNATWRLPTKMVQPGLTTDYAINASGEISSITQTDTTSQSVPYSTNGQTRTWNYAYDPLTNELLSVEGPGGASDTVSYTYDSSGFVHTITNQLGQVTTVMAVNSAGQPTSITDPNGIVSTLSYDGRGRLTSFGLDAGGTPSTTSIQYDASGDVTKITEPNGAWNAYTYDGARRLTTITSALGETLNYVRDAAGNATSVTGLRADSSTAFSKSQAFDALSRIIQLIGASSQTFSYGYDKTNNLTSVTDPSSNVFSYGFDALNRLIQETDEQSNVVNLTRDGKDQITAYEDPRSLSTTYVRNGFGNIIQEVSPDRGAYVFAYDVRGLVTQRTDPRGVVANYTYDAAHRPLTKTYVGSAADNVTFTWDAASTGSYPIGHLTSVSDRSGNLSRTYDSKGRVSSESRTIGSASSVQTQYGYDASGKIASVVYPSGRIVAYTRDAMGRVSGMTTKANASASSVTIVGSVAWNPWGPLQSLAFGNGLTGSFTVNADYRVTGIRVAPGTGGAVLDRTYSWSGDTLTGIADNLTSANSEALTYSAAHRLLTASGAYGSLAWTYDAVGNRTSETTGTGPSATTTSYSYPTTSNQLSSLSSSGATLRSLGYDAAGNVSTDANAGVAWTYGYDVEGRLNAATAGASQKGGYTYDAFGRLADRVVSNTTPSGETHFIYDLNNHVIAETDSTGATLREYLWLDDLPVAVVDAVQTAPVIYFVHTDHLRRPVLMTDASASVVWSAIYAPFGAVQSIAGTPMLDARFPGQWFQLETGLAYNWHRHYDPTLGRYLQPDPMGLATLLSDGPSVYGYATQTPLTLVDPSGLSAEVCYVDSAECTIPPDPDCDQGSDGPGGPDGPGPGLPGAPPPEPPYSPPPPVTPPPPSLPAESLIGNDNKKICAGQAIAQDLSTGIIYCQYYCPSGNHFQNDRGIMINGQMLCPGLLGG